MWKPLKTPHGCSLCMWECNQNFRCEFTWIPFWSKFIVLVLCFKMHQIFQRKGEETCTLNQQNRANNNNILKALWQCCIKKSVFTFQHAIRYCNRPKKCIFSTACTISFCGQFALICVLFQLQFGKFNTSLD